MFSPEWRFLSAYLYLLVHNCEHFSFLIWNRHLCGFACRLPLILCLLFPFPEENSVPLLYLGPLGIWILSLTPCCHCFMILLCFFKGHCVTKVIGIYRDIPWLLWSTRFTSVLFPHVFMTLFKTCTVACFPRLNKPSPVVYSWKVTALHLLFLREVFGLLWFPLSALWSDLFGQYSLYMPWEQTKGHDVSIWSLNGLL